MVQQQGRKIETQGESDLTTALRSAPAALPGEYLDDGTDGIRAVQRALRTVQDFDPLDIANVEVGQVDAAVSIARVVDLDAVNHHQRVVGIGAAAENGCQLLKGYQLRL